MYKTMASIVSLEKIEIIRSQEFMPSEVRLKSLKKMIMLGPKTAILGPQFCRILGAGASFLVVRGAPGPPPPDQPLNIVIMDGKIVSSDHYANCDYLMIR